VRSLASNADDVSRIEFIFRTDVDDDATAELSKSFNVKSVTLQGDRYDGYRTLNLLYADCASYATGDWLWIWNDDARMLTKGWDTALSQVPIKHGVVKFNERDWETDTPEPSIFPIVPRRYYEVLGFISLHPCNDAWVYHVVNKMAGFPLTYLPEFKVRQPENGDHKETCMIVESYLTHPTYTAAEQMCAKLLRADA
jgi:hypothetical protein